MAYQYPPRETDNQEPVQPSLSPRLMPQVARQFPEPVPVVLKVELGATPVATLRTGNSTLQLRPFVEVLAASPHSALLFLFSLDVVSDGPARTGGVGVVLLTCSVLSSLALIRSPLSPEHARTSCLRTLAHVEPSAQRPLPLLLARLLFFIFNS